jgi:hypothetical protein
MLPPIPVENSSDRLHFPMFWLQLGCDRSESFSEQYPHSSALPRCNRTSNRTSSELRREDIQPPSSQRMSLFRSAVLRKVPCRVTSPSPSIQLHRRSYLSTQPRLEEECAQILLILGKPGGGKGTISNKLLQVRRWFLFLDNCSVVGDSRNGMLMCIY